MIIALNKHHSLVRCFHLTSSRVRVRVRVVCIGGIYKHCVSMMFLQNSEGQQRHNRPFLNMRGLNTVINNPLMIDMKLPLNVPYTTFDYTKLLLLCVIELVGLTE